MTNVQSIVFGICFVAAIGGVAITVGKLNINCQFTINGVTSTISITPAQQVIVE